MRTSETLDPTHADSPLPVSREPTDMAKARRAYQRELNPAKYGHLMDHRPNLVVGTLALYLYVLYFALKARTSMLISKHYGWTTRQNALTVTYLSQTHHVIQLY